MFSSDSPERMPPHRLSHPQWVQVRRKVFREVLLEAAGVRFVRFKLEPGHSMKMHTHHGAQLGVLVSGQGIHRFILGVRRGGRKRSKVTELAVRAGDCYFIPPETPHTFTALPGAPTIMVDIMVDPPGPASASPRARRPRGRRVPR